MKESDQKMEDSLSDVKKGRKPLGIYLHIPFCVRKCLYCDFLSFPAGEELKDTYVQALLTEIGAQAPLYEDFEVETVFFGGGTPSLLRNGQIALLLEKLAACFHLRPEAEMEITLEANPGTVTGEGLRGFRRAGVNRLSLGLQSADGEELRRLGRIHDWQDFLLSFEQAGGAGFSNINVDLMSALPGQTMDSWRNTLEKVTALEPAHISAYSLIVEEGTPFYEMYGGEKREDVAPLPGEEEDRLMYAATKRFLSGRGYERYEISNYARSGFACRHNISYWKRRDYAGFGLGAASLRENVRWKNTAHMDTYLKKAGEEGLRTPLKEEFVPLTVQEQMEEFMFLGLRMGEGISCAEFEEAFGKSPEEIYEKSLRKLMKEGLLRRVRQRKGGREEVRLQLTDPGIDVSNYALAEFLF